MSEQSKNVVKSISVLGIAGILCKLIGVLFSIPLNMISPKVATFFYLVYPTYTLLLTISSAGLPVAVSRMVAGFLAKEDKRNAMAVFRSALTMLFSVGLAFSVIMVLCNGILVNMVGVRETWAGFYAIAPCVMIVCVLSAFRGLIQGQQNMVPTAVSQLIEQVGKVILSLPLAAIGLSLGTEPNYTAGAAGALLGITLAEAAALVYMYIQYRRNKNRLNRLSQNPASEPVPGSVLMKRLVLISIPITISACIIPFSQFIDSAMMIKRMMSSGLAADAAQDAYGLFTSVVIRLINIPTALALAVSMSLVPAVSSRRALNDFPGIRREINTGMRYAFLIGFPCSVGMSILSREIVEFFYGFTFTPEKLHLASELLTFSAMTVVLFTVVQATSSILQGLRKQWIPMFTMIAGVTVKIVLNYILIGTEGINIHGGPYASIACYGIVMIANLFYVCRHAKMRLNVLDWIIRPGLAALCMGIVVYLLHHFLPVHRLLTILEVIAGVLVYAAAAFLFKALSRDDIQALLRKRGKKA